MEENTHQAHIWKHTFSVGRSLWTMKKSLGNIFMALTWEAIGEPSVWHECSYWFPWSLLPALAKAFPGFAGKQEPNVHKYSSNSLEEK